MRSRVAPRYASRSGDRRRDYSSSVGTVVEVEDGVPGPARDGMHAIAAEGLSHDAYVKFDAAQRKTAWGRRHQRRFALVDGADVLASATQYDLAAVVDQQPVRASGLGSILTLPGQGGNRHALELIDRLSSQAAREGAAVALLFSDLSRDYHSAGFDVIPTTDVELDVAEPSRRGAPMALIRGGEERDLAAIVAMGKVRASSVRFHLDRNADFVQYHHHEEATACRARHSRRAPTPFLHSRRRNHGGCICGYQHRRWDLDH